MFLLLIILYLGSINNIDAQIYNRLKKIKVSFEAQNSSSEPGIVFDYSQPISKQKGTPLFIKSKNTLVFTPEELDSLNKIEKLHGKKALVASVNIDEIKKNAEIIKKELKKNKYNKNVPDNQFITKLKKLYEKPDLSDKKLNTGLALRSLYNTFWIGSATVYFINYNQMSYAMATTYLLFNIASTVGMMWHAQTMFNLYTAAKHGSEKRIASIKKVQELSKWLNSETSKYREQGLSVYSMNTAKELGLAKMTKISGINVLQFTSKRGDFVLGFTMSIVLGAISRAMIGTIGETPSMATLSGWNMLLLNTLQGLLIYFPINAGITHARNAKIVSKTNAVWLTFINEVVILTGWLPSMGFQTIYSYIVAGISGTAFLSLFYIEKKYPDFSVKQNLTEKERYFRCKKLYRNLFSFF